MAARKSANLYVRSGKLIEWPQMNPVQTAAALSVAALLAAGLASAQPRTGGMITKPTVTLPDGAGRDITKSVCATTCHGPDIIVGKGRTRDQWTAVVNSMVARGAKASEPELQQIAEYLSSHFAPGMVTLTGAGPASRNGSGSGNSSRRGGSEFGEGPGPLGGGAADSHVVDDVAADRGKTVYIAECITCHGNKARGGNPNLPASQQGPDLIRSVVILHDRYGNEIGPYLKKGHPLQSGRPAASMTTAQVADLAHFLHQKVYFTLRSFPVLQIQNVLTGNAKDGAAYFNGAGKCSTCHSPTGDLAGIGKRYEPPTIQSKFLFPQTVGFGRGPAVNPVKAHPVTVTVTQANGQKMEGTLVRMDDFNVALRDSDGNYHSYTRSAALKVEKHDPYEAHVALLDQYTDKNIHDVVAYLESLK